MKWANYKDKAALSPAKPLDRESSCLSTRKLGPETTFKLDSKARLVLPWKIRKLLSVSYGDFVSIQLVSEGAEGLILKISASGNPAQPGSAGMKNFVKTSKNGWEKTKQKVGLNEKY